MKSSSQFYKGVPTVVTRFFWSRCINVSEFLTVAILWLLGCRQGCKPYADLSSLTAEITGDVSEILSVLVRLSLTLEQFRIWLKCDPAGVCAPGSVRRVLPHIIFSCEPNVGQIAGLRLFRMKLPSRNKLFSSAYLWYRTMWSSDLASLLLDKVLILACCVILWAPTHFL